MCTHAHKALEEVHMKYETYVLTYLQTCTCNVKIAFVKLLGLIFLSTLEIKKNYNLKRSRAEIEIFSKKKNNR